MNKILYICDKSLNIIDMNENHMNERNPFVTSDKIEVIKVKYVPRDIKFGIVENEHPIKDSYYYSRNLNNCNIFLENKEVVSRFMELTHLGYKLFIAITTKLTKNQCYLDIEPNVYQEFCNISINSFYKAKKELITLGFIRNRIVRKNSYWINPHIFYKGNRAEHIEEEYKTVVGQEFKVAPI